MSERMLVETVHERHGSRMEPIPQTAEEKAAKKEILFRKVPVIIPVGVMVGINDVANGIGAIRTGWSRCKLPPFEKPETISDNMFNMLTAEGKRQYHAAHAAYEKAVKDSDKFDLERGISEAMRVILMGDKKPNGESGLPKGRGFAKKYAAFQDRCNRYFRDVKGILQDGVVIPNPRFTPPVRKLSPSGEAMLASVLGKDLVAELIKIGGPPSQDIIALAETIAKLQPDLAKLPKVNPSAPARFTAPSGWSSCLCPSCTARRNQQGVNLANTLLSSLPPEIQQVVKMLENQLGPMKIIGLKPFKI